MTQNVLDALEESAMDKLVVAPRNGESFSDMFWRNLLNRLGSMDLLAKIRRTRLYLNTAESVFSMDLYSRVIFPTTFFILNVFYWTYFLFF